VVVLPCWQVVWKVKVADGKIEVCQWKGKEAAVVDLQKVPSRGWEQNLQNSSRVEVT
jgi:hypothetical protein